MNQILRSDYGVAECCQKLVWELRELEEVEWLGCCCWVSSLIVSIDLFLLPSWRSLYKPNSIHCVKEFLGFCWRLKVDVEMWEFRNFGFLFENLRFWEKLKFWIFFGFVKLENPEIIDELWIIWRRMCGRRRIYRKMI
jgi:hypothetical protein